MQSHREELSTLLRQDSEDEEMVVVTTVKPVGQTSLHTKPLFFLIGYTTYQRRASVDFTMNVVHH